MEAQFARRVWLLPTLLLIMTLLLLKPAIFPPTSQMALSGTDFTGNVYPLYGLTAAQVARGELPLWNPYQFIGFPVAGNPQAALFYPATWGIWGLNALGMSVPQAIGWSVVVHIWLAAWGMAVLMRRCGATYSGALAAGILLSMSGWSGSRIYAGHYTMITAAAWIPWFLAAYQTALTTQAGRPVLGAAGFLGLMTLAGHPQMVFYAGLAGFILLVVYELTETTHKKLTFLGGLTRLAVVGIGGIVLGAALVIPTAELTAYSSRAGASLSLLNEFALPPSQLITLILPFMYGSPTMPPSLYWGVPTFEETHAYIGLLPLMALFLVSRLNQRHVTLFTVLAVGGVVLSLGVDGVLFPLLVRWVPGFGLFRAPGRFLYFFTFGLAGLTALLLTHLQAASPNRRQHTLQPALATLPYIGAGLLAGAALFSGWYASASHVEPMPHRAAQIAGVMGYAGLITLAGWGTVGLLAGQAPRRFQVGMWCVLCLITLDAWRVVLPIMPVADVSRSPLWETASAAIPADETARLIAFADPNAYFENAVNNASLTRHLNVEGYDPLEISDYVALLDAAQHDPAHPLFDLFSLRYVLSWEPREDEGFALAGVYPDGIVYARTEPPVRAWVAIEGILQPDKEAARAILQHNEIDLQRTVILDEPLNCTLGDTPGTAHISSYQANRVTVDVESDGGVLVLSDQIYPGWRATINGEPLAIKRAYTVMRGVCVPPGTHTVTFSYRPLSVMMGAVISGISWLLWGGLWQIIKKR